MRAQSGTNSFKSLTITSHDFVFFKIVETLHDSETCQSIILCMSYRYCCIELARVRSAKAETSTVVSHSGVCLIYRSRR